MFERILKDPNALARHQNGPFVEERRRYLAHCVAERMSYETLRGTANYLLIVANALHLAERPGELITQREIDAAAVRWVNMQVVFSKQKGPVDEFDKTFPDLKDSKEFKDVPAHLWVERDPQAIWKDVLGNVNNRVDAAVVLEVLQEWEKFGRSVTGKKAPSDLENMRKELQQRMSTERFGTESSPPPKDADPAKQPSADENTPSSSWLPAISIAGGVAALLVGVFFIRQSRLRSG